MVTAADALDDSDMTTDRTTANKHIVEEFIQALFSDGDLRAVDQYLAPTFVNHDPPFPGAPNDAAGMRQAAVMFRAALPDWHSDLDQLIAENDIVVERFTASGTHQNELMGVTGTGRTIDSKASTSSASKMTRSSNAGAASTKWASNANSKWPPPETGNRKRHASRHGRSGTIGSTSSNRLAPLSPPNLCVVAAVVEVV